jgi:hypothetical protein
VPPPDSFENSYISSVQTFRNKTIFLRIALVACPPWRVAFPFLNQNDHYTQAGCLSLHCFKRFNYKPNNMPPKPSFAKNAMASSHIDPACNGFF